MTAPAERAQLWLWGFMGTGKSTVGRRLAARRGLPFVDLDARIEAESGMTIPEIFASRGETAFRALERRAVAELFEAPEARVVALGGGSLLVADLRARALAEIFLVVLTAGVPTILARTAGSDRPLLAAESAARAQELLTERRPAYAEAHATLVAEDSVDAVVQTLDHLWRHR